MSRKPILNLLSAYQPSAEDEPGIRDRFTEFVETNPNCFDRSLEIGHLTGSGWLVDATGENVLLTHHRKLNIWVQLGGHADGNPDILQVAQREAEEESGLADIQPVSTGIFDLDAHRIPARKSEPEHTHWDVRFAFRHTGTGQFVVSEESHDLAWIPVTEISKFTEEKSMHRMARKWLQIRDKEVCI